MGKRDGEGEGKGREEEEKKGKGKEWKGRGQPPPPNLCWPETFLGLDSACWHLLCGLFCVLCVCRFSVCWLLIFCSSSSSSVLLHVTQRRCLPSHPTTPHWRSSTTITALRVTRGVGTAGALAPAMLKPRGREYLFSSAIFSHTFACCSLNFHSLSLCCLHSLQLKRHTQKTHRPIPPIRLAYVISKMANFYVCCDKQQ